jgi:glyoxylase-like metal-dependent hydrolase (beta-lactamase superfamily II)
MGDGAGRMGTRAGMSGLSPFRNPPSPILLLLLACVATGATACTKDLHLIDDPPNAAAGTTTGPWASMIYVARTDSGVIAIDLGWTGSERVLPRLLATINATTADVRFAFLTHAHRDHIAGWPLVRQARFVLGAGEVPAFLGDADYSGWAAKMGDELNEYPHPTPGDLTLIPVSVDTAIALGRDTVFVFPIPGHTAGSVAYLFRGILFGGDAINWRPGSGFQGARPEFSDSIAQNRESLRALWERLPAARVQLVCTAHGKCAVADSALRGRVLR